MKPQTDNLGLNGRTHGALPVFCCMILAIFALIFCASCAEMTTEERAQWTATGNAAAQQASAVLLDEAAARLRQTRKHAADSKGQ
jgi:hypothetical protein